MSNAKARHRRRTRARKAQRPPESRKAQAAREAATPEGKARAAEAQRLIDALKTIPVGGNPRVFVAVDWARGVGQTAVFRVPR